MLIIIEIEMGEQIEGTIIAPEDPKSWDPKLGRIWLDFSNITKVSFQGNGIIDGSGSKWWAASCKKNKSNVSIIYYSYINPSFFDIT